MSRFKEYLFEMSYSDALKVFGIDGVEDKGELKSLYRKLALKNHPDQGGSLEKIKAITVAYDILNKSKVSGGKKGGFDWEASNQKFKMAGAQIKTALLSSFQPDVFLQYFQDLSGFKFNYEIVKTFPLERDRSPSFAGFDVEFFTKDRSSVFTMKIHASLSDIVFPKAELGFGDLSYTVYTEAHGFHLNKKQKMSQSDWKHTRDHSFFRKPEQLFPKKKMKDIFSGKTSKRAFKKRDMYTFFQKKLGARINGDDIVLDIGEGYSLYIYRATFSRVPFWSVNGIYLSAKGGLGFGSRVSMATIVSFAEEEETAKIFEKIQKEAMKVKGEAKIKKTNQLLKLAHEAYRKSKGI